MCDQGTKRKASQHETLLRSYREFRNQWDNQRFAFFRVGIKFTVANIFDR